MNIYERLNLQFDEEEDYKRILNKYCKNSDGIFILTGINENISRLIAISQLENIFNVVGSVDEGIDLIFMEEIEKELKRN